MQRCAARRIRLKRPKIGVVAYRTVEQSRAKQVAWQNINVNQIHLSIMPKR